MLRRRRWRLRRRARRGLHPLTDERHCGACGHRCPEGASCVGGRCICTGGAGHTECDGTCVDPATDEAHCGSCGTACAYIEGGVTEVCTGGRCVACGDPGESCCDTVTHGGDGCGAPGSVCVEGRCTGAMRACHEGACDAIGQTCTVPGEGCYYGSIGAGVPPDSQCAEEGHAGPGERCENLNDCRAGLACSTRGECQPYCCDGSSSPCPPGGMYACVAFPGHALGICTWSGVCEVAPNAGCRAGEACYPTEPQVVQCVPEGLGAEGAPCSFLNGCVAGSFCADALSGSGRCARMCRLAMSTIDCPGGGDCTPAPTAGLPPGIGRCTP